MIYGFQSEAWHCVHLCEAHDEVFQRLNQSKLNVLPVFTLKPAAY